MIYGENKLASGIVTGRISELPAQPTSYGPPLITRVLARHQGNIVNVAQIRLEPGQGRESHSNPDVDELFLAVEGIITITSDGESVILDASEGGFAFLPHGADQSAWNHGSDPATLLTVAVRNENFVHLNQNL